MSYWKPLLLLPLLSACSLYRSEGRKTLEGDLSTIGVTISSYVETCDFQNAPLMDGRLLKETELALTYAFDSDEFQMRVVPLADDSFRCDYKFPNAKLMFEQTDAAVDYTLERLSAAALKASNQSESSR